MNEEMKQGNQGKLDMLLDLLEHPEKYTESQKKVLLNDEEVKGAYQQMVEIRETLDYQKSREEMTLPSVSEEWERLKKVKSEERRVRRMKSGERRGKSEERRVRRMKSGERRMKSGERRVKSEERRVRRMKSEERRVRNKVVILWSPVRKVAAIIAILIVSGIAFAAIRMATRHQRETSSAEPRQAIERQDSVRKAAAIAYTNQAASADTTATGQLPLLYENAELQSILVPIAEHFHLSVSYKNESARHIRLYLQLTEGMTLDDIVELMNHFEKVKIKHEGDKLIVE